MNPIRIFLILLVGGAVLAAAEKPNILVILTDDQGYADVGFHDLPTSRQALTPNLDRLASEGISFRNGYVACSTCGPSRQSLLTGRTSSRFGVEENGYYAPTDEIFIPRALEKTGYVTAMFGKWHCGETEEFLPKGRGFDEAYPTSKTDFFMKKTPHPESWKHGDMPEYGPYEVDAVTDQVVALIRRCKAGNQPFFAYVAHHAPHSPFCSKEPLMRRIAEHAPEYRAAYERMKTHASNAPEGRRAYFHPPDFDFGTYKGENLDQELLRLTYLSMLLAVDDGVGRILEALKTEGLRENTLIFYLSDNGAALARPNDLGGVNLPLRSGKGSVFDGGVRVPFVMSWPGTLEQGVTNSEDVVSSMDIFTTTVELAGGKIPGDRIIDGVNLIPYLTGEKEGNPHEVLFFRRLGDGNHAIRNGDYKLNHSQARGAAARKEKAAGLYPEGGGFYNIQDEITETTDLSAPLAKKKRKTQALYDRLTKDLPVPMDVKTRGNRRDED